MLQKDQTAVVIFVVKASLEQEGKKGQPVRNGGEGLKEGNTDKNADSVSSCGGLESRLQSGLPGLWARCFASLCLCFLTEY